MASGYRFVPGRSRPGCLSPERLVGDSLHFSTLDRQISGAVRVRRLVRLWSWSETVEIDHLPVVRVAESAEQGWIDRIADGTDRAVGQHDVETSRVGRAESRGRIPTGAAEVGRRLHVGM